MSKKPLISPHDEKPTSISQSVFSPEELEEQLQAAVENGDDSRVLELLDSIPKGMKNQPEYLLIRASALMSSGQEQESLRLLIELERKYPHFWEVYAPLAILYMDRDCPAHALRAANRALSDRNLLDEVRDTIDQINKEATADLQHLATRLDVSMEIVQQGAMFHEKARIALDEGKFADADYFAQKAIKLIPAWVPPFNNRAKALYFSGKPREAMDISESVLVRDPGNAFALLNLTIFYYGLDQSEQAHTYASRLMALAPSFPSDSVEIEHVITALALVEDTPALWKFAQKYHNQPPDILFGRSWHCLAVAAARSGKWKIALDLMRKAEQEDELSAAGKRFMDQLEAARRLHPVRLAWTPPEYPGMDLLLNEKVLSDLLALLNVSHGRSSPPQQRKLASYVQKYPFVKVLLKLLLLGESSYPTALDILAGLNQPDADDEILRFAFGQVGSQEARVQAIMALMETGRYTGSKAVRLWNEELGEWREVEINTQRIGDLPLKAKPQTMAMIEKAHQANKPEEAISLLRKAVEFEPSCAMAWFNLGVMLAQNGNAEEGETLIRKSVTVDPDYTFGHASIALFEASKGNEKSALDHLEIITHADLIAPETALIANLAWCDLALKRGDVKTARRHYDFAAKLNPEHPLLEDVEADLKEAEKFGFMLEYQRESALRAHQKLLKTAITAEMNLRACMETLTRDMLAGSAKFIGISSSGKKGELASSLTQNLLDTEFLRAILANNLKDQEREALRWVLEAGGVRPWKEFMRMYGDDTYESTFWVYQEPVSIPGRLKLSGLLYAGTLENQQVVFIPPDVRAPLIKLLK